MNSAKAVVLLVSVFCLTHPPAPAQSPTDATPQLTVAGMRAFLTYNKTGELSENVLDAAHPGFRNSIVGPNASDAMLVVIELAGPPKAAFTGSRGTPRYLVRLVAREGKTGVRVHDRTVPVPILNDSGKVYVSFLVRQDGCLPIRLTASVVGPRSAKPFERSVNFSCGE